MGSSTTIGITLDEVSKRYDGVAVVHRVSLDIAEGEMLVLLGASGSGKSTILRMIAGLTEASEGRILLAGRDVTSLPPQSRDVGFVFQSYALFRHLTVAGNVEFPLRIRGVSSRERARRRSELLDLVGLGGLADRLPRQLSGGQQQRVALARALAHRPKVLLLDEPFGALDARIRADLRGTIRDVQRGLGVTTVFVTHDQDEAFELADRLAVLHLGRLLEVGPPAELYLHPRTELVASFLGTANLLVGETTPHGVRLGPVELPLGQPASADGTTAQARAASGAEAGDQAADAPARVQVLFRPEDVALEAGRELLGCPTLGRATVESRTLVGPTERLRLRVDLAGVRAIAPPVPFGADHILVEATRSQHHTWRYPLAPGDATWVGVRRLHALTHPGLALLAVRSDARPSTPALDLAAEITRLASARLTVLLTGEAAALGSEGAEPARARLPGTTTRLDVESVAAPLARAAAVAVRARTPDLTLVDGPPAAAVERVEAALLAGDSHVLWVPDVPRSPARTVPSRALVCAAVGEPGKQDVGFAGRLLRHLGASATVLTVLPANDPNPSPEPAARFLDGAVRTLRRLGISADGALARGNPAAVIGARLAAGDFDLLAIGAPLPMPDGSLRLHGVAARLLHESRLPVLVVRSGGPRP